MPKVTALAMALYVEIETTEPNNAISLIRAKNRDISPATGVKGHPTGDEVVADPDPGSAVKRQFIS